MKIAILGAGAIGSLFGAKLSNVADVTLVGRRQHVEAVNALGLHVSGRTEGTFNLSAAEKIPDEDFDLIILITKAYDTDGAVKSIPERMRETPLLSLQNGLTNLDVLRRYLPERSIILGVTSHGARFLEPGSIEHTGIGETVIGIFVPEAEPVAHEIVKTFNRAGIETKHSENILGWLWVKAIMNSAINPITAITGLRNGRILEIKELSELCKAIVKESFCVAQASGIKMPEGIVSHDAMIKKTFDVIRNTADNKSSMLQDIERGRHTEIDSINGEIVRIGKIHGIQTPLNNAMIALIRGIEILTLQGKPAYLR